MAPSANRLVTPCRWSIPIRSGQGLGGAGISGNQARHQPPAQARTHRTRAPVHGDRHPGGDRGLHVHEGSAELEIRCRGRGPGAHGHSLPPRRALGNVAGRCRSVPLAAPPSLLPKCRRAAAARWCGRRSRARRRNDRRPPRAGAGRGSGLGGRAIPWRASPRARGRSLAASRASSAATSSSRPRASSSRAGAPRG